ncbi:TPA: type II secretion system protein [Vibrio campbellii]|nr:type II secretion system protein [Vibrio campbellii]
MKQNQGFTLIELVVVIVLLGILAVVAAPKFLNLQSDARIATLNGVKGSIQAANQLVYSKSAIDGIEEEDCAQEGCSLEINGETLTPVNGLIRAAEYNGTNELVYAMNLAENEWNVCGVFDTTITPRSIYNDISGQDCNHNRKCYVRYRIIADEPVVEIEDSQC